MAVIVVFALLALLSVLAMTNANTVRRLHHELRLVEKKQLRKSAPAQSRENEKRTLKTNGIVEIPFPAPLRTGTNRGL